MQELLKPVLKWVKTYECVHITHLVQHLVESFSFFKNKILNVYIFFNSYLYKKREQFFIWMVVTVSVLW